MQPSLFERARQASKPDDPFELHWKLWPRKDDKQVGRRAYAKALKKIFPADLDKAIHSYLARIAGTDKQFVPMFSTWLNKERWCDEEPKEEVQTNKLNAKLDSIAWHVKRGIRSTSYGPQDVELAYRAGKVTAEECEKYGVRV